MMLRILEELEAGDGATKYLLGLPDGERVESVFLELDDRNKDSLCISSQVGCALKCSFCRTGLVGLRRDLTADEIVAQVRTILHARGFVQRRRFDLSFMGMGEPLENLDALLSAKESLTELYPTFHLGLSTVGVVPGIRRLAKAAPDLILQISLHAPTDELRTKLMAINRKYPIAELLAAAEEYAQASGRVVVLNYCLMEGVNNRPEHAHQLADLCAGRPFRPQLVEYNPDPDIRLDPPSRESVNRFARILTERGTPFKFSGQLGHREGAGCGQLDAYYELKRRPVPIRLSPPPRR